MDKIAHNLRKMFDLRQGLKLHTSMSFRVTTLRRSLPVIFLLGCVAGPAFGQLKTSPIAFDNQTAIVTSFVAAPNIGGTGTSTSDAGQWLKVEFHYGTTSLFTANYLDQVEFKIWIEGRDRSAPTPQFPQGFAVGLTGSVVYVNIPAGKDIYGVFYVHPSTLGRYSTERGYTDFDRKFDIHIQALIGGVLMDEIDKNKGEQPGWFQALRPVPDLVYRQNQSPFMLSDPDRYPAIRLTPPPAAQ
jgi:hypothetical protein